MSNEQRWDCPAAETRLTPVRESIAEVENEVVTPGVAVTSKKRGRPSNSTLMNEKAEKALLKVRRRGEKERLDEDKFHQALNIVNTCEVSKREAARRVSLPYSTFLDRLEALESHGAQPKGGRIFEAEEEGTSIIGLIIANTSQTIFRT